MSTAAERLQAQYAQQSNRVWCPRCRTEKGRVKRGGKDAPKWREPCGVCPDGSGIVTRAEKSAYLDRLAEQKREKQEALRVLKRHERMSASQHPGPPPEE